MTLQALLVSKDDDAAEALSRALASFGVAVERSSDPEVAANRLSVQRFDEIIVDFDEPEAALHVLQNARQLASGTSAVTVALIADESQVRQTFGAGANFVLIKPVSPEQATASLRAATALLKRERRRAFRVPVQAAVSLSIPGGQDVEAIMLDLSETGLDVLAAQPMCPSALVKLRFCLPDLSLQVEAQGEVAWANPNGQSGIRFLDLEESLREKLRNWLTSNSAEALPEDGEAVAHCKLTDLSPGGCYVETESPFPERALVDLCLRAGELEVHAEGLVRVMHPSSGMGIEFPARTSEQRSKVADFIGFLTTRPGTMPDLLISPRKLVVDESEFAPPSDGNADGNEEWNDALLELLHSGHTLSPQEFLAELRNQRNSEEVSSS
jgi:CheY-like chemotaxis protein